MRSKFQKYLFSVLFLIFVNGCATASKQEHLKESSEIRDAIEDFDNNFRLFSPREGAQQRQQASDGVPYYER